MKRRLPTIDEVLRPFFAQRLEGATGIRRKRIQQIEVLLREYLEAEADPVLTSSERALIAAERQFQPIGAFSRTMDAEALLFTLLGFLTPPHLAADPLLQRTQLSLAESLIARLVAIDLAGRDLACFWYDLRAALDRAKCELNQSRREQQQAR
jgi:hypothetical protein